MPIYNETWNENDYLYGSRLNLKSLTKNHLLKLKSLKFDFVEYKVSEQIFFFFFLFLFFPSFFRLLISII